MKLLIQRDIVSPLGFHWFLKKEKLTLKASFISMDSRSESKGMRVMLNSSTVVKEPYTPFSWETITDSQKQMCIISALFIQVTTHTHKKISSQKPHYSH